VFTSTLNSLGASSITGDSATISSDSINKLIGGRVRLRRTSLGISPRQLSKFLRIDRNELDAYEAGAKRIKANLLFRTAKILDVPPGYFFRSEARENYSGKSEHLQVRGDHRGVRRRSRDLPVLAFAFAPRLRRATRYCNRQQAIPDLPVPAEAACIRRGRGRNSLRTPQSYGW
jgi:transcriptional regulator with XRE-family HTH domain